MKPGGNLDDGGGNALGRWRVGQIETTSKARLG
jgi:hypothetical protein